MLLYVVDLQAISSLLLPQGQLPQRFILEKYSLLEFAGIADTLRCVHYTCRCSYGTNDICTYFIHHMRCTSLVCRCGNILALNDCIDRNEVGSVMCIANSNQVTLIVYSLP